MRKIDMKDVVADLEHELADQIDQLRQRDVRASKVEAEVVQADSRSALARAQLHAQDGIELDMGFVRVDERSLSGGE